MKCPACGNELTTLSVPGFDVDVCKDGCAGIWFDKGEFESCNDNSEPFPNQILGVRKSPDVLVDKMKPRQCPRCKTPQTLKRSELEFGPGILMGVDSCPKCEGVWLDTGELQYIRRKSREAEDRQTLMKHWGEKMDAKLKGDPLSDGMRAFVTKLVR